jgi:hypothetical protein
VHPIELLLLQDVALARRVLDRLEVVLDEVAGDVPELALGILAIGIEDLLDLLARLGVVGSALPEPWLAEATWSCAAAGTAPSPVALRRIGSCSVRLRLPGPGAAESGRSISS